MRNAKAKIDRVLAMLLTLVMLVGTLPISAFAIDPALSSDRSTNLFEYVGMSFKTNNSAIHFAGSYDVPFDKASGYPMFCVNHAHSGAAANEFADYTYYVGNGQELTDIIAKAKTGGQLSGASPDKDYLIVDENGEYITPEILETLGEDRLQTILQMMSVLYANKGKKYNLPDFNGTGFSVAAVNAVQTYIWSICWDGQSAARPNPNGRVQFFSDNISTQTPDEQAAVWEALTAILQDVEDTYINPIGKLKFSSDDGNEVTTQATADKASKASLSFGGMGGTKTLTVLPEMVEDFQKIKYISIDGGPIQSFEDGASIKTGVFTISRSGNTITATYDDETDEKHTVQFLTSSDGSDGSSSSGGTSSTFSMPQGNFELPVNGSTGYAVADANGIKAGTMFVILGEEGSNLRIRLADGTETTIPMNRAMINLPDVIPSIVYNATNATGSIARSLGQTLDVTGKKLYTGKTMNNRLGYEEFNMPVMYNMAKKIMTAQQTALSQGKTLILYEGFRPVKTQEAMGDALKKFVKENYAGRESMVYGNYSPAFFVNNAPVGNHQMGVSVDISLGTATGTKQVLVGSTSVTVPTGFTEDEMPTAMHELSQRAKVFTQAVSHLAGKDVWGKKQLAESFASNPSAVLLQEIMTSTGLDPLCSEWWHFNDNSVRPDVADVAQGAFEITGNMSAAPNQSSSGSYSEESWAIYAQYHEKVQSYFGAYIPPASAKIFLAFSNSTKDNPFPYFPKIPFRQHKLEDVGGYDNDVHTPTGGSRLDAQFTITYETDKGAKGTKVSQADVYGHGAMAIIDPWDAESRPDASVVATKEVETDTWDDDGDPETEEVEFEAKYIWTATCTVTITEREAPDGHNDSTQSFTHTIKYKAETQKRETPDDPWKIESYTIEIDGKDTGLKTDAQVIATWDNNDLNKDEDVFTNDEQTSKAIQIIKTRDNEDIFSEENGKGTQAGGVVAGKVYSTDSEWTIRVIDESIMLDNDTRNFDVSLDEALEFEGYENCPYIKVVEDSSNPMNELAHCYKVMLDGTGTPADEDNPLTPSEFGQIIITNIPYGTYLVTEIKADGDRYVKESSILRIPTDNWVDSLDINNSAKENVLKVVKVDSETGKTIPSVSTTFRIRYMGSDENGNPEDTPNYGRLLPNASNINASVSSPEDYIFHTDSAGEVTIPYVLPYGTYQLEELLVPDGYYIGTYGEDGKATTAPGQDENYGEDDDNHQVVGDDMDFEDRVAIFDQDGNRVDYTKDENVVFNYYTFQVSKQNDHLDGDDYHTYYLTVEMKNTAAKGKIQISKLGEKLVGFKEITDDAGNVVNVPIYESMPLSGVKFGIYAADDVMLEDGEEPPVAYEKLTGEEIEMVTDIVDHLQFPGASVTKHGVHDITGAEIIHTRQRDKSENNISTVEYLTPAQKGTIYTVEFTRRDEDAGLTYAYEIEIGLEYTAGGWNYSDIKVKRTITADDYVPEIPDDMPKFFNGEDEVTLNTASFSNKNKMELNSDVTNEYNEDKNHFTYAEPDAGVEMWAPQISDYSDIEKLFVADNMVNDIEIPAGYSLKSIDNGRVTIVSDTEVNDVKVLIIRKEKDPTEREKAEQELFPGASAPDDWDPRWFDWEDLDTADTSSYFVPRFTEDAIENMPDLDPDVEFLGADRTHIYVKEDGQTKVVYKDSDGNSVLYLEDGSDIPVYIPPDIPAGYEYTPGSGAMNMIAVKEDGGDYLFKVYVYDEDLGDYRWIDCDDVGVAYIERVQEFDVTLTQHNTSTDGWKFEMDGIVLTNIAENEDTATAELTIPYDVEPEIKDTVGCDITTEDLEPVGVKSTLIIKHPDAPIDFEMIDGTRVEMVYLGGFTKTTITVPAGNEMPTIYRNDKAIDYFDEANGGLGPDNPTNEIVIDDYNYVRVTRHGPEDGSSDVYFVIEVVSDATEEDDAFLVKYHGAYESVSIVVPDAETGALRGNLQFRAIDKTMRYPMSDLVEEITTGADGIATSSLLPLGDYVIRELEVPEGFVMSTTSFPVSLEYRDQFTPLVWASVEAENGAMNVQLDITKGFETAVGSGTYVPKAGAVFGVYTYNSINAAETASDPDSVTTNYIPQDTLVATVTVGEDGKAVENIKLPKGDYYVKEISTIPGYELNDTQFIFRVDDSIRTGNLEFASEYNGYYGKIQHTGYKTAEIEIVTYARYPMPSITVNDIEYALDEDVAEGTVGNNVLISSTVDSDRTTTHITGSVDKPVTVEFMDGSKLIVTIGESDYTAEFIPASESDLEVDTGTVSSITEVTGENGGDAYHFDPMVAFTGYTAESSSILVLPQTKLTSSNGTSLEFEYDLLNGVKKAVITYPSSYDYYDNDDLPTKGVRYKRGDIDQNGTIESADRDLLDSYIQSTGDGLTENQLLIADLDKDSDVDSEDLTALDAIIAAGDDAQTEEVTVQEPYMPDNAIKFETEGFGNVAYVGTVVNREDRTVTIDLSKLPEAKTVTVGDAVVTLNGDTIKLEGGTVRATNTVTKDTVSDGLQPDSLTLSDGNTLTSPDKRTISLSSYKGTNEMSADIDYDYRSAKLTVTGGTLTSAWLNGASQDVGTITSDGLQMAPGNTATLVFSDTTIYRVELSNTGYFSMSAEGIVDGDIDKTKDIPILKVDGSEDNFQNVKYRVITQTMPMDETSFDSIRQYNIKNVTYARNDGFVKQLQVKINAASSPEDHIEGPGDRDVNKDVTNPIPNDMRPHISKVDATSGAELAGAYIEIYDVEGNVIASGTSDMNGKFYFEKPEPGTYTFKEISAPSGYEVNTEVFTFTVNPDGSITGDDTIKDYHTPTPHTPNNPEYTLHKTDVTTGKGVPGAKIEVLSEDKTKVVASGTSDANGNFSFSRPAPGTYWFHEVVAPDGYVLNQELFQFTVNSNGTVTGDNTITDERTRVTIYKTDLTTGEGVPGAFIEVFDKDGNIVASGYSDDNGEFGFYRPDAGTYWFHEVVAPDGYILNEELFSFTIDAKGNVTGDDTITNKRIPSDKVIISKLDVTTSEGVPGAEIEVLDEDNNIIASGVTDDSGHFGFERPAPGTYWFHEVVAPDGYLLNEELFSFEVLEDGTIIGDCTITDIPNEIIVKKVERKTNRPLTGASVEFWDENGMLVSVGVSDENGNIYFAAPAIGTYIYREKIAPEGYILDEGTHIITLHADGTITGDLVLVNTPYVPRTGLTNWTPVLGGVAGMAALALLVVTIGKRKKYSDR